MWWLSDRGLQAQYDLSGLVPCRGAAEVVRTQRRLGVSWRPGRDRRPRIGALPPFNFRNWAATVSAGTNAVDSAMSGAKTPEQAIDDMLAELAAL